MELRPEIKNGCREVLRVRLGFSLRTLGSAFLSLSFSASRRYIRSEPKNGSMPGRRHHRKTARRTELRS